MTQHSEERLPETEGAPSVRTGARILPFERPQSELQRAIQQRAQETIDLNRERDREKRRPQPLKWLAIFALACVPVVLTFSAVDGFVRVFQKVAATYSSAPSPQQTAPSEPETASQSQPGVVILESFDPKPQAQRSAAPPSTSPSAQPTPAEPPSR